MTAGDWFLLVLGLPLTLVVGWVSSYRVWLRHADVGAGMEWVTGESGQAGYHAFILPATLSFTAAWLGIIAMETRDALEVPPAWLNTFVNYSFLGSIGLLLLGFWMWLFMWPRALVPPHLRGVHRLHDRQSHARQRSRET